MRLMSQEYIYIFVCSNVFVKNVSDGQRYARNGTFPLEFSCFKESLGEIVARTIAMNLWLHKFQNIDRVAK